MQKILANLSFKAGCVTVALLFLTACDRQDETHSANQQFDYPGIYEGLWLVHNGLEFPPSRDVLELCKKNNYQPCLDVVRRVESAIYLLTRLESNEALQHVLQTVSKHCNISNNRDSERLCVGATNALFYFKSETEDKLILKMIAGTSRQAQGMIFATDRNWLHNRPDNKPWVSFINNADFTGDEKKTLIGLFESKEDKKFGLLIFE